MNDGCREGRGRREGRKGAVKLGFSEVVKDGELIQLLGYSLNGIWKRMKSRRGPFSITTSLKLRFTVIL